MSPHHVWFGVAAVLRTKTSIVVRDGERVEVVARHQRAVGKGAKVVDLDHYLESGDPVPQARRPAWRHGAGAGPRVEGVHRRA